jgi:hypothetical protein
LGRQCGLGVSPSGASAVIGQWAMGIKEATVSDTRCNTILSMPHAHCPLPHSPFPNLKRKHRSECTLPDGAVGAIVIRVAY